MRNRSFLTAFAVFCGIAGAQASPDAPNFTPSAAQLPGMQMQANSLASSISAVIQAAESSAKSLSSTDRESAIQSAIQGAITASGDDPHVVLNTLQAFTLCPGSASPYSVTQIPVSCANLKTPLSPEAREALATVEKVIVALVDQSEEPGALGNGGQPAFAQDGNNTGRGGGGGNNSGRGGSSGNPVIASDPALSSEPGPGGGGPSGYIN